MKRQEIRRIAVAAFVASALMSVATIAAASTLTLNVQLALDNLHEDVSQVHVICSMAGSATQTISHGTNSITQTVSVVVPSDGYVSTTVPVVFTFATDEELAS